MLGWEENSNVILQTKDMKLKTLGHEQIEFCVCIKGLCRKIVFYDIQGYIS